MKTLAAIDIGTNTIRMLVAKRRGNTLRAVERIRRITGMGRDLRNTGRIGEKEFAASVSTLREFRRRMDALGVVQYRACGTAALRGASNSDSFLEAARSAGVNVEVITAAEEARRTWKGIHGRLRKGDSTVVMDIGGGSTEFIAGDGGNDSVSLPIGVVVACDLLPFSDPPEPWQILNARLYFSDRIRAGTSAWGKRRFRRLVGTAGTFTTLAALEQRMRTYRPERIDGYEMPIGRLRHWEQRLGSLRENERLALPGMEKGRERYIVPGVCQAIAAMECFGTEKLVVSDAGLLEGILLGITAGKGEKK